MLLPPSSTLCYLPSCCPARPCSTRVLILWMSATSLTRSQIGHESFSFRDVFEIKVLALDFSHQFFPTASAFTHWISHSGKNMRAVENVFWQPASFFVNFTVKFPEIWTIRRGWHFAKYASMNKNTFFGYCFCSLSVNLVYAKLRKKFFESTRVCGMTRDWFQSLVLFKQLVLQN